MFLSLSELVRTVDHGGGGGGGRTSYLEHDALFNQGKKHPVGFFSLFRTLDGFEGGKRKKKC